MNFKEKKELNICKNIIYKVQKIQVRYVIVFSIIIGFIIGYSLSYLNNSPQNNHFTYNEQNIISNSNNQKYIGIEYTTSNILLKQSHNSYYIYNMQKDEIIENSYTDAICVTLVRKGKVLNEKAIIVKSSESRWLLINNDGKADKEVMSNFTINHNVISLEISGIYPIALMKLSN